MKMTIEKKLEWLENPEIFKVNRMKAHSDHSFETPKYKHDELVINQNGKWRFSYYKNIKNLPHNFYKNDCDDSSWDWINVPGHIQLQGYGRPQYVNTMYPWDGTEKIVPPSVPSQDNPAGIYSHRFTLPKYFENNPVYISFDGVESSIFLWCNGEFVGYSEDSFTPSEFELTPHIVDGENRLCALVVHFCSGSWLEDQDFWRFSGIFRDVNIYTVPKMHIYDVHAKPLVLEDLKTALLECDLTIQKKAHEKGIVCLELLDSNGISVASTAQKIQSNEIRIGTNVQNVKLWSAEIPYLYTLKLVVQDEKENIVEMVTQKIGFRRFELKDNIMTLNGERLIFRGVNRHEFNPRSGRVISEDDMIWDIKCMKRNNINAVRTSHYPNNSLFYKLCDEYGLYVIDEANIETHGSWMVMGEVNNGSEHKLPHDKTEWLGSVLDRGESMLERDKNHPSILVWSCGNEAYGGKVMYELSQYYRQRDSMRLVHYEGIFHDRSFPDTSDMESRMYAKPSEVVKYLENSPTKPFILCEYSHAMGNSCGNLHEYTKLEDKYSMYQGGFIWDFIDQAIYKTAHNGKEFLAVGGDFGDRPNDKGFCGDGIVFANRIETPQMQEIKFLYQPVKIVCDKDRVTIYNKNLFVSTNVYKLYWSVLSEGVYIEHGSMCVDIAPQSSETVEIPFSRTVECDGELILDVSMRLAEDTLWEKSGYEIGFGQGVIREKSRMVDCSNSTAKAVDGDVNTGFVMDTSSALFWKVSGKLISLKSHEQELLTQSIQPDFWRAPTDNDYGNGNVLRWAQWKLGSLYSKTKGYKLEENAVDENGNKCIHLTAKYDLNMSPNVECELLYSFYGDNKIVVCMKMNDAVDYDELPCFGFSFGMPVEFSRIAWYGNGPEESEADRKCGCRLELFETTVMDSFTPYLNPQYCGNKTDLRWIEVKNRDGCGIKISSSEPFECSVLPYSSHQLELANHQNELPPVMNTYVHVKKITAGVGGDDSWGAPVHGEYLAKTKKNMQFTVCIELI